MENKNPSLKTLLVEWILSTGPTRSLQQIAQCEREAERIAQKYFDTPVASASASERPAI